MTHWDLGQAWETDGGDSAAGLRCRAMRIYFEQQHQARGARERSKSKGLTARKGESARG
jgi:hypothetical protein